MEPRKNSACPYCGHEINPVCLYCIGIITHEIYWLCQMDKNEWDLKFVEWECDDCKKRWGRQDGFHE